MKAETHKFESHYIDNLVGKKVSHHFCFGKGYSTHPWYELMITSSTISFQEMKVLTMRDHQSTLLINLHAQLFCFKGWMIR
jgi:hypothetical protein